MAETTLKEQFVELLDAHRVVLETRIAMTENRSVLLALYQKLRQVQEQLSQPMRVAIVGIIKAGKSTLMNALMGENLVATGAVEATFNVNWFKYGEAKSLLIHYKDKRPPEPKSFEDLEALTLRAKENKEVLLSIEYIQVFFPSIMLQKFNLIDTPGLASTFKDDEKNALEFLQLHGEEISEATLTEASKADAVLYLFAGNISELDKQTMTKIQGSGNTNPFNAIGVLTRADIFAVEGHDPISKSLEIIHRLQSDYRVLGDLFYTIRPICGLLALGAQTLSTDEFEILQKVSKLPCDRFNKLISDATRFCEKEYPDESNIPPASQRKLVFGKLDRYGLQLAYTLLNSGVNSQQELKQKLSESSGLPELRELIIKHFGDRADFIKLNKGLQTLKSACFNTLQNLTADAKTSAGDKQIVANIAGELEKLELREIIFDELKILKSLYDGILELPEKDKKQLLEVTGEYGKSLASRLGLSNSASTEEMTTKAKERYQYWQQKANDRMLVDSQVFECANVIMRSYMQVLYNLRKGN